MGCDISAYPERLENGEWVTAEPFVLSKWWYETILDEDDYDDDYDAMMNKLDAMSPDEIMKQYGDDPRIILDGPWDNNYNLRGRNYAWFAILAGVRNGFRVEPMFDLRGVPDDVSPEVKREATQMDLDGHSHSWVTLRELLEYDWDGNVLQEKGMVGKDKFMEYKIDGRPSAWAGGVSGGDSGRHVTNYQMGQICLGVYGLLDASKTYYTKIEWELPYRHAIGESYLQGILDKLSDYGEPDDVRLVFWFDN